MALAVYFGDLSSVTFFLETTEGDAPNVSPPEVTVRIPGNAAIAGATPRGRLVLLVLRVRHDPEVGSLVIEWIAITVVSLAWVSMVEAEDRAMKRECVMASTHAE